MTQNSPMVRFNSTKLSDRFELQSQGISVERKINQALITSVCDESTGIWAFTESCTCRFTEATATPTRTSEIEIERGFRNIAVGGQRQPIRLSRLSLSHVRLRDRGDAGLDALTVKHVKLNNNKIQAILPQFGAFLGSGFSIEVNMSALIH